MTMDYVVMFRGRRACPCLAEWIPVMEKLAIKKGFIKYSFDIAQLIGGAPLSGGTHTTGGAADIWQSMRGLIEMFRMGGAAAFARTEAQGFSPHTHLVLNGCPHNAPARYQIVALETPPHYNGLGAGGRGGLDTGPYPKNIPTFKQGIAWAKAQLEEDMPLSADDLSKIKALIQAEVGAAVWGFKIASKFDDENLGKLYQAQTFLASSNKMDHEILGAVTSEPEVGVEPPKA